MLNILNQPVPFYSDWKKIAFRYFLVGCFIVKDGLKLSAGVMEFNFIQLILYPKRMFK